MKKRIMVFGMGGTISSTIGPSGLSPGQVSQNFISLMPELLDHYEIETKELMAIDSSNLQPHHWSEVAERIYSEATRRDIDGIVIAHGTDTMSYTASAIAFMIQQYGKPIVFTGSQIPFSYLGSDGRKNIVDAILVAAEADIAETVIVFDSKIHRAVRSVKLREYDLNAFESTDPTIMGEIGMGIHLYDPMTIKRSGNSPTLKKDLNTNVALLKVFPGMKPEMLTSLVDMGYEGLVLDAYGAGNVPILENSLLDPIKSLTNKQIPVVITSQCVFGTTELLYETGILANKAGAIQGFDMIAEVALIKLMWVMGKTTDFAKIRNMMQRNIVGELNPYIQSVSKK
ncbi:MAG: asparaginase [Candidatus Heimdallarchaeota archaeon]|nr:asparaginase [Candidatus Heimdallarchaeota archaeon]